jgi:general stress protein YciG
MTMAEKGAMTVAEAGRKGGRKTKQTQGPDFYKTIGKKGGDVTKERHGPEHYERIGKKGGAAMKKLVAAGKRAQTG